MKHDEGWPRVAKPQSWERNGRKNDQVWLSRLPLKTFLLQEMSDVSDEGSEMWDAIFN